jgi:hypothetical protein
MPSTAASPPSRQSAHKSGSARPYCVQWVAQNLIQGREPLPTSVACNESLVPRPIVPRTVLAVVVPVPGVSLVMFNDALWINFHEAGVRRRRFTREFKVEAVKLVRERRVSVAQAARDLDVHENVCASGSRSSAPIPFRPFVVEGTTDPVQTRSRVC